MYICSVINEKNDLKPPPMRKLVHNQRPYSALVCLVLLVVNVLVCGLENARALELTSNITEGEEHPPYVDKNGILINPSKNSNNLLLISGEKTFVVLTGNVTIADGKTFEVTGATVIIEGNLTIGKNSYLKVNGDGVLIVKHKIIGPSTGNGNIDFQHGLLKSSYLICYDGFEDNKNIKFKKTWGSTYQDENEQYIYGYPPYNKIDSDAYKKAAEKMEYAGSKNLLPIELTYFSASENAGVVDFAWETSSEYNNDFYTIEYSRDGSSWSALLEEDGAGTTSDMSSYVASASAQQFSGLTYFRLKQTDYNGEYSYSDVTTVAFAEEQDYYVYPNPAEDVMTISGAFESARIIDIHQRTVLVPTEAEVTVSGLPAGVYHVVLTTENGMKVIPFIKK